MTAYTFPRLAYIDVIATVTPYSLTGAVGVVKVVNVNLRRRRHLRGDNADPLEAGTGGFTGIRVYTLVALPSLSPAVVSSALLSSVRSGNLTTALQQTAIDAAAVGLAEMNYGYSGAMGTAQQQVAVPIGLYLRNGTEVPHSSAYTPIDVTDTMVDPLLAVSAAAPPPPPSTSFFYLPFGLWSDDDEWPTQTIIVIAAVIGTLIALLVIYVFRRRKLSQLDYMHTATPNIEVTSIAMAAGRQ